jgi:hypothetical protein
MTAPVANRTARRPSPHSNGLARVELTAEKAIYLRYMPKAGGEVSEVSGLVLLPFEPAEASASYGQVRRFAPLARGNPS